MKKKIFRKVEAVSNKKGVQTYEVWERKDIFVSFFKNPWVLIKDKLNSLKEAESYAQDEEMERIKGNNCQIHYYGAFRNGVKIAGYLVAEEPIRSKSNYPKARLRTIHEEEDVIDRIELRFSSDFRL